MNKPIRLAIVDDSSFFRRAIINLIQADGNLKITIECSNGKEAITSIKSAKHKPDIVILDLEMPVMDGVKTAEYLSKYYPKIKILILTVYFDYVIIRHLINKVRGFLDKEKNTDSVIDAINVIYKHDFYFKGLDFKKIVTDKPSVSAPNVSFTKRELEVIKLISQQYSNKKISAKLFISVRTVHEHRKNLYKKTGSKDASELAVYAVKYFLISDYSV